MNNLSRPAKLCIAGLSAASLGLTGVLMVGADADLGPRRGVLAAACAVLMAVAWLRPLSLSFKRKLFLDTSVLVATILLFEPAAAVVIVGVGTFLGQVLRRPDWAEAVFNTAQMMLQAAIGAMILALRGGQIDAELSSGPFMIALVVLASTVMYVVNNLAVAVMVAAQSGMSPLHVAWQAIRGDPIEFFGYLAQVALGVAAAALFVAAPWALPLLLYPAVIVFGLVERNVRLRRQAEAALHERDAALADVQRVAHVGSWDWNLTTGEQSWSDETFRILGYDEPDARTLHPTFEAFLHLVHPDDRTAVDGALHEALYEGRPFAIEHRFVTAAGTTRLVLQRGEVVLDGDGRKVRLVGTLQDITERKALEAQLARQALSDPLTGLPNRVLLFERLAQALAREGRPPDQAVAALLVDLDNFTAVNSTQGHDLGDQLLAEIARRLRPCLGASETLARLGGDRFVVMIEATTADDAAALALRILEAVRVPIRLSGRENALDACVGIATSSPMLRRPAELIQAAEAAVDRAKAMGSGAVVFKPGMQAGVAKRQVQRDALAAALERGELELHFQPEIDLASGQVVGFEALARWSQGGTSWVLPSELILLAEETGLIREVGRWALWEACRRARSWQERNGRLEAPPMVGVNVAAEQVLDPCFPSLVENVLRETRLTANLLQLEMTERVLVEDVATTRGVLDRLRGLGVRLAIDDFGAGYSSLGYLRRLPVQTLKIDRSFVSGLDSSESDRGILQAITSLAHSFGMEVTAEGIETPEQLAWASAVGCDRGQGFFFAPPLRIQQLDGLLAGVLPFEVGLGRLRAARAPVTPAGDGGAGALQVSRPAAQIPV